MEFKLTATFLGLCSAVPDNQDLAQARKLTILLPDATTARPSIDGTLLRAHIPVVFYRADHVKELRGLVPPWTVIAQSIYQRDLALIPLSSSYPNTFMLGTTRPNTLYDAIRIANVDDNLDLISPSKDCFVQGTKAGLLSSSVEITAGKVETEGYDGRITWELSGALGKIITQQASSRLTVSFEHLERIRLSMEHFKRGAGIEYIDLVPDSQNIDPRIYIGNLCEIDLLRQIEKISGIAPEKSSLLIESPPKEKMEDTDFRWHYELCEKQGEIRRILGQLPLPVPVISRLDTSGGSFGQTRCMVTVF